MTTHTVIDGKRERAPYRAQRKDQPFSVRCEPMGVQRRVTLFGDRGLVTAPGQPAQHLNAEQTEALRAFVDLLVAGEGS